MDRIKFVVFCVGTVLFNTLFWNEELGLNLLVFQVFILASNVNLLKNILINWQGKLVISSTLISSGMLIIHHSSISYIASIVSTMTLIGYLHFSTIRTSFGVLLTAIVNLFKLPEFMQNRTDEPQEKQSKNWRTVKLIIVPFIIFFVFGIIFYAANLFFRNAIDTILNSIDEFLNYIFGQISFARIFFFIFAAIISSWVVYKGVHSFFADEDAEGKTSIYRKRTRTPFNEESVSKGNRPKYGSLKTLGLKNEFTSSLIMIVAICGLLFIINSIDIFTVWFEIGSMTKTNYAASVHDGVNLLIISIILSIVIMLYVFRKNQNFYAKRKSLVIWSKVWIVQNVVLIVSVIIRNFYYISHYGLTHKRIGVFIFLVIVIAGLVSLFLKISKTKSFYFMSYFNSWSLYIVLILMSTVNWDTTIAKYGLEHKNSIQIDPYYLTSMSDESIIYLWNNQKELNQWLASSNYRENFIKPLLENRIAKMQRNQCYKSHSWTSWNLRRSYIQNQLAKLPKYELHRDYEDLYIY